MKEASSLHLLTGAWGAGKSSVVPHLLRLLPECVVFDWDSLIPGVSSAAGKDVHTDPSTWDGLWQAWAAVVGAVLAGGRDVVLCGPATPDEFTRRGALVGVNVRCAYLDCPDHVLVERLRARGESEAAIGEELAMSAALRRSGCQSIPVANPSSPQDPSGPSEVAERVAQWVRMRE